MAIFREGHEPRQKLSPRGLAYPIGHFSFGVSLCRTESGKTLDLHDPQSLRAYIQWEYHDYFETPAAGRTDCLRGHNYDVRQECERMFPEEERRNHIGKQGQYEIELKNRLKQMPEDFGTTDFAGEQWTSPLEEVWIQPGIFACR